MKFRLTKTQFNLIMSFKKYTCAYSDRPGLQNIRINLTDNSLIAEALNGYLARQITIDFSKIIEHEGQGEIYIKPIKPPYQNFDEVEFATEENDTVRVTFIGIGKNADMPHFVYIIPSLKEGWKNPDLVNNLFFDIDKTLTMSVDGNLLAKLVGSGSGRNIIKICFQKDKNGGINKCQPISIYERYDEDGKVRSVLLPVRCGDEE